MKLRYFTEWSGWHCFFQYCQSHCFVQFVTNSLQLRILLQHVRPLGLYGLASATVMAIAVLLLRAAVVVIGSSGSTVGDNGAMIIQRV